MRTFKFSVLLAIFGFSLGSQRVLAQATEDCGYENGVQRLCGNGYAWIFGKDSYAIEGNHQFGEAPRDAEWEYLSKGWDSATRSCEQNKAGVFIAAPNITIREAESARYRNLYFSLPITILMEAQKRLSSEKLTVLRYELQANGKTLIAPKVVDLDWFSFDATRKFASYSTTITGHAPIENQELKNVKLVVYDLLQKADPSKDFYCYSFDIILGKGRIDLVQ